MTNADGRNGDGVAPFPPAITQWSLDRPTITQAIVLAPPFRASPVARPAEELVDIPWEDMPDADEGVVEAAFGEDVERTTEANTTSESSEFPIEAFMIPEDSKSVPSGIAPNHVDAITIADHPPQDSHELADRFDRVGRRLRAESLGTLLTSLAKGDRFDASVGNFIVAYFSAKHA
jgi:hypothetical protein